MGRLPVFDFDPVSWSHETAALSPAARGGLMDIKCTLWGSASRGMLKLPIQAWARVLGTSIEQCEQTINELVTLQKIEIEHHSNADITLISRSMIIAETRRKMNANRQERKRSNADITHLSRENNADSVQNITHKEKKEAPPREEEKEQEKENPPAPPKEREIEKEEELPPEERRETHVHSGEKAQDLLDLWNEKAVSGGGKLPQATTLTQKRKAKCLLRLRDRSLEDWGKVFELCSQSPFLCGDGNRGWRASFDWIIMNADNSVQVLEGKYESKPTTGNPDRIAGYAAYKPGKYLNLRPRAEVIAENERLDREEALAAATSPPELQEVL